MPLVLTDADLADLNRLMRDWRHCDAVCLIEFLQRKRKEQNDAHVKAMATKNGADAQAPGPAAQ